MSPTRTVLVTGANRGIGLEIVRQLAERGLKVWLGSRNDQAGAEARDLLARDGLDATVVKLDVSEQASIATAIQRIEQTDGRLDVLVNNAGILVDGIPGESFLAVRDVTAEMVRQTFDINVVGALQMTQAVLPIMERNHYGRIVNMSSALGQLSNMGGGLVAYRMSKTALNAMTRILAAETDPAQIKVNAMSPGWVRTDMGGADADRSVADGADTAIWLATLDDDGPSGGFFQDRKPFAW